VVGLEDILAEETSTNSKYKRNHDGESYLPFNQARKGEPNSETRTRRLGNPYGVAQHPSGNPFRRGTTLHKKAARGCQALATMKRRCLRLHVRQILLS